MKYKNMPEKPAMVYEVFLPKRMNYASKLAEVLDAFITPGGIENIPAVKDVLDSIKGTDEVTLREQFIDVLCKTISGYSIYEVDGRFNNGTGPIKIDIDRVLHVRSIGRGHTRVAVRRKAPANNAGSTDGASARKRAPAPPETRAPLGSRLGKQ